MVVLPSGFLCLTWDICGLLSGMNTKGSRLQEAGIRSILPNPQNLCSRQHLAGGLVVVPA